MKIKLLPALLFAALVAVSSAADLKLSDGRAFKDYQITAQTPTRVTVRHAGGMVIVDKKLLPPELLKAYPIDEDATAKEAEEIARGKAAYEEQARATREKRAADHAAFLAEVQRRREAEEARRAADRSPSATQARVEAAVSARSIDPLERIEKAVRFKADQYYKSQRKTGSGQTLVFELNYLFDDPVVVPNWPGRYEVKGECLYQYYDAVWGGTFSSGTGKFTADVRVDDKGSAKVVDFTAR